VTDNEKIHKLFKESLPVFSAMGDPIRQRLIMLMIEGERKSVAELAKSTNLSRPTVSHHLKILKNAHILAEEKVGTKTYYTPQMGDYFKPIAELVSLIVSLEEKKGNKT
jgi:ArsR family transcriptional regulator, arsenate/arsenite/antimonite-responsive transcriptional repressor